MQTLAASIGAAFTVTLLTMGLIPDYVGIGYLVILALPVIVD